MSRPPSPELTHELGREPAWMYPWEITGAPPVPLLNPELPSVHQTRVEMMEGPIRAALAAAGPGATAVDLACSEGYFTHLLLEWGAHEVVGVDVRATNIRRAELVREYRGVDARRMRFVQADVLDLDAEQLGRFDVVLLLGLIYHLEDPVGAIRLARAMTRGMCVIESQLTKQREAIQYGWGTTGSCLSSPASFAARIEHDSEANPIASTTGTLSLIPNAAALELMVRAAGFTRVEFLRTASHHNQQYVVGDRAVLVAR